MRTFESWAKPKRMERCGAHLEGRAVFIELARAETDQWLIAIARGDGHRATFSRTTHRLVIVEGARVKIDCGPPVEEHSTTIALRTVFAELARVELD